MSGPAPRARLLALATAGVTAMTALTACAVPTQTTTSTPTAVTPASAGPVIMAVTTPPRPTSKAPALATTSTTWPTVLTSLITYGQWLLANPNPALVPQIATPGCPANDQLSRELQSLIDDNSYVQPHPPMITRIWGPAPIPSTATTAATPLGGQVTVGIQATRTAEPVIARNSTTRSLRSSTIAELPPTEFTITLNRGADNKWRFCGITANAHPDAGTTPHLM